MVSLQQTNSTGQDTTNVNEEVVTLDAALWKGLHDYTGIILCLLDNATYGSYSDEMPHQHELCLPKPRHPEFIQ